MEETTPPADLTPEEWAATPPRVRALLLSLLATVQQLEPRVAELEARLNQTSRNSSKPPSSNPPSASPPPAKPPRGKPKNKGAQSGHPDQQRELLPVEEVNRVVPLRPSRCPACQHHLASDLPTVGSVTKICGKLSSEAGFTALGRLYPDSRSSVPRFLVTL
jgi:transposase